MNTQSNAEPHSPLNSQEIAPAAISATRLLYWSVRRELWEYRFIYLAPLAAAGVALFGFLISMIGRTHWMGSLTTLHSAHLASPYDATAGVMMGTMILVAVFYCADALYGERRDRSILFWKSLPVSDLTTVLAKASIPFLVLPLITFAITVAMQLIMLLLNSAVLQASGMNAATLWTQLSVIRMWLLLLYHLFTAHTLWPAPVYCWLLLVSGWARRATLLWAVLPVVVIAGFEKLVFQTAHFAALVGARFIGAASSMAVETPGTFPTSPMTHITPGIFLASPGLWIGLAIAAAFLAAAVRLRRYQGPI
ncbi:MAG: ABC transporter permease [Terriglobales bacterium]|jgi:ABC-2 type transport system permease protein